MSIEQKLQWHQLERRDFLHSGVDIRLNVSTLYLLPLVAMAMPIGMSNGISQPLAIILCIPAVLRGGLTISSLVTVCVFLALLILNSVFQVVYNFQKEYSSYQAVRSLVPFLILLMIVTSYKERLRILKKKLSLDGGRYARFAEKAIGAFAFLCAMQTALFFVGIKLANSLSMTGTGTRVMIFQTTSCVFLSYYAIERRRFFVLFCLILVALGSGSKSILVAQFLVMLIALFSKFSVKRLLRGALAILVLVGSIALINPTSFLRVIEFTEGSGNNEAMGDATRAYEIGHAKATVLSNGSTFAFGAGFLMQLTPGVPSLNAAWAENSKYDIENGYWGVFAKLGMVFTGVLIFILIANVPFSRAVLCAMIVESMMFFKTSYQIFAYMDGVYLMMWLLLTSAILQVMQPDVRKINLSETNLKQI